MLYKSTVKTHDCMPNDVFRAGLPRVGSFMTGSFKKKQWDGFIKISVNVSPVDVPLWLTSEFPANLQVHALRHMLPCHAMALLTREQAFEVCMQGF